MLDSNFLKEHNARSVWHPMAHPAESIANPPAIIVAGSSVEIQDIDGHQLLDAVGGLWNVNLGYSCEPIKTAIAEQLDALPYYSAFRGTSNDKLIRLSEDIREFYAPDGLSRAFYTSGGSDSVETALRLARQYHKVNGQSDRVKFLSLKFGYHGTHFGGASVNGNAKFRTAYEPLMPGCYHIPAPYEFRNPYNEADPAQLAKLCLKALEDEIAFQGAGTIAAFIMEPVLGAGGVIVPHESFMPGVREICSKNGILLIADEVVTAYGRTGDWTGSRHWGVQPDILCSAKAITNGYFPFGVVMLSDAIAEAFESDKTGKASIGHGYTYSGHPVGAAAAIASLKETLRLDVAANAAARGQELKAGLQELEQDFGLIGNVRCEGLMAAIELVADPESKKPIDKKTINEVYETAYQKGVMVRTSGANIILSPPLVITSEHVARILSALRAGFETAS